MLKNIASDLSKLQKSEGTIFALLCVIIYIPAALMTDGLVMVMDVIGNWWDKLTQEEKVLCFMTAGLLPASMIVLILIYRIMDLFGIIDLEADKQPRK